MIFFFKPYECSGFRNQQPASYFINLARPSVDLVSRPRLLALPIHGARKLLNFVSIQSTRKRQRSDGSKVVV